MVTTRHPQTETAAPLQRDSSSYNDDTSCPQSVPPTGGSTQDSSRRAGANSPTGGSPAAQASKRSETVLEEFGLADCPYCQAIFDGTPMPATEAFGVTKRAYRLHLFHEHELDAALQTALHREYQEAVYDQTAVAL